MEATISTKDPNFHVLKSRLNHRGGNRPFTERELLRIEQCQQLHLNGHYSPRKMKQLIVHTPHCPLTNADIDNWTTLHWPCPSCVQGTIKTAPQRPYHVPTNALPGEYFEVDVLFNDFEAESRRKRPGMLFICLVSGILFYHAMQSRATPSMIKGGQAFHRFHLRHFPSVQCQILRSDHEYAFEHVAAQIKGCLWKPAAIGDHANHIENAIGHIKRRTLSTLSTLIRQGIDIPKHLLSVCFEHIVHLSNHIPNDKLGGASPGSFASNFNKLTFEDITTAQFGKIGYFKRYPIPTEALDLKGDLGMIVGFEPATPTNVLVYIPRTNNIVSRGEFTPVKDLSEFKELMKARAKGGIIDDSVYQSKSEFMQIERNDMPDEGLETIVNSIEHALAAYNIIDLNKQMRAAQAISIFGNEEVTKGVLKELDNLITKYNVTQFVRSSDIPTDTKILDSTDIYKGKTKNGLFTEVKVRIVVRGDRQLEDSYSQTSSPTVDQPSINTILSLAKYYRAELSSADVPAAYLQSKLKEQIYMRFSKQMSTIVISARPDLAKYLDDKGRLLVLLLKSLYGLKQAGANWFEEFIASIIGPGFTQSKSDPCIFYKIQKAEKGERDHICICGIHVDDVLRICNHLPFAEELEASLSKYGDMRWEHKSIDYLSVHYEQQPDFSVRADMSAMTERILTRHGINKPAQFPSVHNLFEQFDDEDADFSCNVTDFLSQTMEINYITKVRVDIAKEATHLASLAKNPGPVAYKHLHHLQAYLYRTKDYYILYGTTDPTVNLYVDAAFAVHPQDSTSHGGIYITLGNNTGPVYVRSSKIKAVCLSICEAELWRLVDGVKIAYPIAKLLEELQAIKSLSFVIQEDNEAAIIISHAGEGRTGKSKAFRVRYDFLRQLLKEGTITIRHCKTENMIADYLTKGMVENIFERLTTIAMGLQR